MPQWIQRDGRWIPSGKDEGFYAAEEEIEFPRTQSMVSESRANVTERSKQDPVTHKQESISDIESVEEASEAPRKFRALPVSPRSTASIAGALLVSPTASMGDAETPSPRRLPRSPRAASHASPLLSPNASMGPSAQLPDESDLSPHPDMSPGRKFRVLPRASMGSAATSAVEPTVAMTQD